MSRIAFLPLETDWSIRRYAQVIDNMCRVVPPVKSPSGLAYSDLLDEVSASVPVTIIHCRDDEIVSYKCSMDVCSRNAIRFVVYPSGGHFVIFGNPELLSADIGNFVGNVAGGD